jgi:Cyclin, N-terminal domain
LVDWLIDLHSKFKMVPETLFIAVNIIDRYLSKIQITRVKLQLLGVGAVYIASKF